ncbi:hypothetical protein [Leifsonia shinshuensis]|uniref:Uncharacterized protein n=1 Tax=Leifsonia shinshuensis TaxID=150026 RepID=A0A7G6YFL6_9MICO|nr:hypothetical protein [Leifsonia shinshuensis]QNE37281.1 hypothetical protein F1C12_20615 [Leifsonia shinshuensis]
MANPAAGAVTSELTVGDLMALARLDDRAAVDGLTMALTWRYEHTMTLAKALAAAGSGVILSLVVPVLQSNPGVNPVPVAAWLWVLIAGTATMLSGGVFYVLARRAQRTFVLAQGLLAELLALRQPPAPPSTAPGAQP